jgi:beta-glucanase (GH16 family)
MSAIGLSAASNPTPSKTPGASDPWTALRAVPKGPAAPSLPATHPAKKPAPKPTPKKSPPRPAKAPAQPVTPAAPSPAKTTAAAPKAVPSPAAPSSAPVQVQAGGSGVPAPPAGYTTVFADSFDGPAGAAPSKENWFYDIGTGFGNNEVQHTTNSTSNTYLDGQGDLILQANDSNGNWTSSQIETTRDDFTAPPGGKLEMTASIEQPNVANELGYWPAFWALGAPMRSGGTWPNSGEIDMLEDINGQNSAAQTIHYGSGSQIGDPMVSCPGTSCEGGFNTYSVIIDRTNTSAEFLQFVIDGHVEATDTEAQVGTADWQAAFDHGFFILLDLAIGGTWPNGQCNCTTPTSGTTSGGQMRVAYVAVYQSGG